MLNPIWLVATADIVGHSLALAVTGYTLVSLVAVLAWRARRATPLEAPPPVSVLKPLHGGEPELYEDLRSFCEQDYPDYQLVFGLHDAADPALEVVRRLQREWPALDIRCVIDGARHGSNHKVSNLINIDGQATHDWLVLADSDIRVGRDYLRRVVAPLARADTGIVTCLYRGRPVNGFWSQMGALFINEWFAPSVLVARLFGSSKFAFGATIALRRDALRVIGGFRALANHLADDYRLGELTRAQGLRTVLSDCVVETSVVDGSAAALLRHELRWLRTIRTIQPSGYALLFLTFSLPLALLAVLLAPGAHLPELLLALTAAARAVIHYYVIGRTPGRLLKTLISLPLLLLRDALSLAVWAAGFRSRRVVWGAHEFTVADDGSFRDIAG